MSECLLFMICPMFRYLSSLKLSFFHRNRRSCTSAASATSLARLLRKARGHGRGRGDGTDGKMWIHNDRYEYFLETNGLNIIDMDKWRKMVLQNVSKYGSIWGWLMLKGSFCWRTNDGLKPVEVGWRDNMGFCPTSSWVELANGGWLGE